MADEQGAAQTGQDSATESPSAPVAPPTGPGARVLATREGQFVCSIARVVALAQCLGLLLLVAFLVRYHTQISGDLELAGMSNTYSEITEESGQIVTPAIMLVPLLAAVIAAVSWGVWRLRPWARRVAILFSVVLIAGGVGAAYFSVTLDPQPLDSRDLPEMVGAEDTQDILQLAAIIAGFYGVVLGLLLLPSVGRVFAAATAEDRSAEERFTISEDASRGHFQVKHEVDQL
jgi:hypothetical protein